MQFYRDLATDSILNRKDITVIYSDLVETCQQDLADDLKALQLGLQLNDGRLFRLAFYLLNSDKGLF